MPKIIRSIDDLTPDDQNANIGTVRGLAMLEDSLSSYGAGRGVFVDNDGRIIGGNKTVQAAADAGIPIQVIQTDGTQLIVVQRTDLSIDSPAGRSLAIADNRVAELDLQFDPAIIQQLQTDGADLTEFFTDDELSALIAETRVIEYPAPPASDEPAASRYTCPYCGAQF